MTGTESVFDEDGATTRLEKMVTARELADILGFASGTVVDWFERGELPGYRIGGRLRFRVNEVEDWLAERHNLGGVGAPPPNAEDSAPTHEGVADG